MQVILVIVPAFRLQEQLVGILVGKGAELVLDARAIARAATMDQPCEQGRAVEAGAKDIMDGLVRMKDVAVHLRGTTLNGGRDIQEREAGGVGVADLDRKIRQVHRTDVDPRGSAGLHPSGRNAERRELVGDMICRELADAPPFERVRADEHLPVQEGPGGQNNRLRFENCPGNRTDARQNAILKEKIFDKIRINA